MKVLFWANSPCIRTYKEAKALNSHGVETVLAYSGKTLGERNHGLDVNDAFSEVLKAADIYAPHFMEDMGIDIIHTAHPPDCSVRDLLGCGVPIVHDFHDLYSLQRSEPFYLRTEKDAAQFASGLVFVTKRMASYVKKRYKSMALMNCLVANAADDLEFKPQSRPWPLDEVHVVYIAAMPRWDELHYKDIKDMVDQLTGQRIHVHVYAFIVKPEIKDAADKNPLFHLEEPVVGAEKIGALSRFDAAVWPYREGLPSEMSAHVAMCCPNKLYEYWQAGIPVVCCGGKETRAIVETYKIGWMAKNFSDLRSVIVQKYKPTRKVITMRAEVTKLIKLYEDILWR